MYREATSDQPRPLPLPCVLTSPTFSFLLLGSKQAPKQWVGGEKKVTTRNNMVSVAGGRRVVLRSVRFFVWHRTARALVMQRAGERLFEQLLFLVRVLLFEPCKCCLFFCVGVFWGAPRVTHVSRLSRYPVRLLFFGFFLVPVAVEAAGGRPA